MIDENISVDLAELRRLEDVVLGQTLPDGLGRRLEPRRTLKAKKSP